MSLVKEWDELIAKLKKKLSKWKLKTLSIGGRLTLLKAVLGSTPIYNMSLFKVPKQVLNSMERMRMNFFNGVQEGERKIAWVKWSKVLASKKFGGLGVSSFFALNRRSPLNGFGLVMTCAHVFGTILGLVLSAVLFEGGQNLISSASLRIYLIRLSEDIWFFDLNGDGRFCVKDVRCLLDDVFLPKAEVPTRNVAVASLLCPLCDSGMEDAAHLFFRCDMAKDVMFLNSVEVLKILKNKLESMKIMENKLESLKLQKNQPVDGLIPLFIKNFTSESVFERLLKRVYGYRRNWSKCTTIAENHREEEDQEGNNSSEIETLTYYVLATYG
uniref:RNA-directed DNA polymerase, eukaryota n=1 Tax=Tanacetum cinerariifolium TaxID=118510 RepID=A0A6L2JJ85_TANCI|nr:RNA-directed DNA polymerase, eukaryota [Tanacetum cinerariifolium]